MLPLEKKNLYFISSLKKKTNHKTKKPPQNPKLERALKSRQILLWFLAFSVWLSCKISFFWLCDTGLCMQDTIFLI